MKKVKSITEVLILAIFWCGLKVYINNECPNFIPEWLNITMIILINIRFLSQLFLSDKKP